MYSQHANHYTKGAHSNVKFEPNLYIFKPKSILVIVDGADNKIIIIQHLMVTYVTHLPAEWVYMPGEGYTCYHHPDSTMKGIILSLFGTLCVISATQAVCKCMISLSLVLYFFLSLFLSLSLSRAVHLAYFLFDSSYSFSPQCCFTAGWGG